MNAGQPLAVVDIGSNSSRLVVFQVALGGHVEVLRDARGSLRLARELQDDGRIGEGALERTIRLLQDFQALIAGAGAAPVYAVATSAIRESANVDEFVERVRAEAGLDVQVIDGRQEARYAFLGAVYGLPVDDGFLIDIGGGSLEVGHFRGRVLMDSWTLPLGALRVSDAFLGQDPPADAEVDLLAKHVTEALVEAGVPARSDGEVLVGTGGSIRNMAKMDRARRGGYPIHRLHGYTLREGVIDDLLERTRSRPLDKRAAIPGLNADRADSIVGGLIVARQVMEHLGASTMEVSGQGLREGLILHQAFDDRLPPAEQVRRASVFALAGRFAGWAPAAATRRAQIALDMLDVLDAGLPPEVRESVEHAAHLLEIGRNIDYYNRHQHTADIVEGSDLQGFSHRGIALLAAVIRAIGNESVSLKSARPLLRDEDRPAIVRAGLALALSEEIDARIPHGRPGEVTWTVEGKEVRLTSVVPGAWRPRALGSRFRRTFGRRLVLPEA